MFCTLQPSTLRLLFPFGYAILSYSRVQGKLHVSCFFPNEKFFLNVSSSLQKLQGRGKTLDTVLLWKLLAPWRSIFVGIPQKDYIIKLFCYFCCRKFAPYFFFKKIKYGQETSNYLCIRQHSYADVEGPEFLDIQEAQNRASSLHQNNLHQKRVKKMDIKTCQT